HGTATPDVLLHDDFAPGKNKDVYVENTGETDLVVRVQFAEFLQVGNDVKIGTDAKDSSTWRVRTWAGTTIESDGTVAANDNLHNWLMTGAQKLYQPGTSEIGNVDYSSYQVGDIATGGNGNPLKDTLAAAPVITMTDYLADKDNLDTTYPDGFWILDDSATGNGWCYWSKLLPAGEATNLLLDNVTLDPNNKPDDNYAYNIDVRLQAANETEAYKLGQDGGISTNAQSLVDELRGVTWVPNPNNLFGGKNGLLKARSIPGKPNVYEALGDNGQSQNPPVYIYDPDGSIANDKELTDDEVVCDAQGAAILSVSVTSVNPTMNALTNLATDGLTAASSTDPTTMQFRSMTHGTPYTPADMLGNALWEVTNYSGNSAPTIVCDNAPASPYTATLTIPANYLGTIEVKVTATADPSKTTTFTIAVESLQGLAGPTAAVGSTFYADNVKWRVVATNQGANNDTLIMSEYGLDYLANDHNMWNDTVTTTGGYAASNLKTVIDTMYAGWSNLQRCAVLPDSTQWTTTGNLTEMSTSTGALAGARTDGVAFALSYADVTGGYFGDSDPAAPDQAGRGAVTDYNTVYRNYWLRTPRNNAGSVWLVFNSGGLAAFNANTTGRSVRPALFIHP
ncbi:MAG: DUF6273 domain-containing protein, partial [Coriobacteriia bacterium]|nr:DUF6273 domain-containing protein [Coriobacteriia bacterium]